MLRNNQVQLVCFWCCVAHDFVVQIHNFFSLILIFVVIHLRRGMKLTSKIIKYKVVLQRCNLLFFILKRFFFFFENYRFWSKSGNDTNSRRWGSCSLSHYDVIRTKIDMWFAPQKSLQLLATGMFKFVWPFSRHQALKG